MSGLTVQSTNLMNSKPLMRVVGLITVFKFSNLLVSPGAYSVSKGLGILSAIVVSFHVYDLK